MAILMDEQWVRLKAFQMVVMLVVYWVYLWAFQKAEWKAER